MRAFDVEFGDEFVERGLLLQAAHGGLSGRVFLQYEMHASSRLFSCGLPGLIRSMGDTEAQPPDGELGEVEQGVRASERDAVIGADGIGQAVFSEQVVKGFDGGVTAWMVLCAGTHMTPGRRMSNSRMAGARTRFAGLERDDEALGLGPELPGIADGSAGLVGKRCLPLVLVAGEERVAALARDAELSADAGHGLLFQDACDETKTFFDNRTLFPRHRVPNTTQSRLPASIIDAFPVSIDPQLALVAYREVIYWTDLSSAS